MERNEDDSCSKFAQGSRRMRGREGGPREAKKIHIKVKRGKLDGATRSKGEGRGKGGKERKKRGRRTEGRKRGARREFARFIPPPVFKLRPDVFPSPASLSALRFLLNRWYRTLSASRNPAV